MQQYLDLVKDIFENGHVNDVERTGVGTKSVFGRQMRFNLEDGFPLLTSKKVFLRGVIEELLWFLSGSTNIAPLLEKKVYIWNAWADENGDLGPIYGKQWRSWQTTFPAFYDRYTGHKMVEIDQIAQAVDLIKNDPGSRRIVVSAWNPADIPRMALAPCHCLFQFNVRGEYLDLQLYQRSADLALGVPFNIASYAILLMMMAHVTGKKPGEYIHTFGNVHIYNNHVEGLKLQLTREPRPLPRLEIIPSETNHSIDGFKYEDFVLTGYNPHPVIKFPVAV